MRSKKGLVGSAFDVYEAPKQKVHEPGSGYK